MPTTFTVPPGNCLKDSSVFGTFWAMQKDQEQGDRISAQGFSSNNSFRSDRLRISRVQARVHLFFFNRQKNEAKKYHQVQSLRVNWPAARL